MRLLKKQRFLLFENLNNKKFKERQTSDIWKYEIKLEKEKKIIT